MLAAGTLFHTITIERETKTRTPSRGTVFAAAQRNSVPLDALATLYGRVSQAQTTLKASSAEVMRVTDIVAQSLRVAGRSASESSGALLQLAAMRDGMLHRLGRTQQPNANGQITEIDAEANKTKAVAEWLALSEKVAARDGETFEQRFARELSILRQNGAVHPEWKSTMEAGIKTIAAATASNDKLPPAFTDGFRRYSELRAKAPDLLTAHLSKEDRERWEVVRVMIEDIGLDPSKAALQYATFAKDPVKFRELLGEGTRKEIVDEVQREFKRAANQGHVLQAVHKRAFVFAGAGLSTKDAIKRAVEEFKRSHRQINGHYLDMSDRAIPPDFEELAKAHIDEYVRKHGKREQLDASDIALESATGGFGGWVLRNVHTGDILDNADDRLVTLDTLATIRTAREDAAKKALVERSEKRREHLDSAQPDPGRDTRQLPVNRIPETVDAYLKDRDERRAYYRKEYEKAAKEPSGARAILDSLGGMNATEADVPEAIPPGGRYRDIVRGN